MKYFQKLGSSMAGLLASLSGTKRAMPSSEIMLIMAKISRGDYSASIDYQKNDEFGLFIDAFKSMIAAVKERETKLIQAKSELEKSALELESKVEERTKELQNASQAANKMLQDMRATHEELKQSHVVQVQAKEEFAALSNDLEEKVRVRTYELFVLYDISNAILLTMDYNHLFKLIMESLFKIVDYDICGSLLFDVQTANITIKPAYDQTVNFADEFKRNLIDSCSALAAEDMRQKNEKVFVIPAGVSHKNNKIIEGREYDKLRSFFNVPFVVRGKVVGIISVSSCRENAFDGENTKILYTISNLASNAIERLRNVITAEKSKMGRVLETMSEGAIMMDESGEVVVINPRAVEMLSSGSAGSDSKNVHENMKNTGLDAAVEESKQRKMVIAKEIILLSENTPVVLRCEISPVINENLMIGTVVIIRDITAEKKIDQMKNEFISTVSHELRTPLTVIREGVSQVLEGILGEISEDQRKMLSLSLEDIDRLARIINSLLDISKIESGKVRLQREFASIVALAKTVALNFAGKIKAKGLELKENYPDTPAEVYVDKDKTIQVFVNLIGNAIKFTSHGFIEITVRDAKDYVEFSVADTGKGIGSEDMPRVFNRFQQFGRVEGEGEKGTGLGLSIAKGMVELHGGRIRVESKINEGTKFFVMLPKYSKNELLVDIIDKKIETAIKEKSKHTMLVYKINNLSEFEKVSGREKINECMDRVVRQLESVSRANDMISRYLDNEILAVVVGDNSSDRKIENIYLRLIKKTFYEQRVNLLPDISYGHAVFPKGNMSAKELIGEISNNMVEDKKKRPEKTIMIADDDPNIVKALKFKLREMGYVKILEAFDGQSALTKIKAELPDLVILDMAMPGISGYEVIGRLKEEEFTKDIPVLIVTAFDIDIVKLKNRAIPIVQKPFNDFELSKWMDYLL